MSQQDKLSVKNFKRSLLHITGVRVWKSSSVGAKIFVLRWDLINLMESDDVSIYNKKDVDLIAQTFHNTVIQIWPWLQGSSPFSISRRLPVFMWEAGSPQSDFITIQIWFHSLDLNQHKSSCDRCDSGKNYLLRSQTAHRVSSFPLI